LAFSVAIWHLNLSHSVLTCKTSDRPIQYPPAELANH